MNNGNPQVPDDLYRRIHLDAIDSLDEELEMELEDWVGADTRIDGEAQLHFLLVEGVLGVTHHLSRAPLRI